MFVKLVWIRALHMCRVSVWGGRDQQSALSLLYWWHSHMNDVCILVFPDYRWVGLLQYVSITDKIQSSLENIFNSIHEIWKLSIETGFFSSSFFPDHAPLVKQGYAGKVSQFINRHEDNWRKQWKCITNGERKPKLLFRMAGLHLTFLVPASSAG